jgi:serine phosphatase RsbU (regulator of sigma subunit)
MAVVTVLGPPMAGLKRGLLQERVCLLGRGDDCDVVLKQASISRHHARIVSRDGEFFLEDLGSTNGTFLNGTRVTALARLHDGDVIHLHNIPLQFDADGCTEPDEEPTLNLSTTDRSPLQDTDNAITTLLGSTGASILRCRLDSLVEIARQIGGTLDLAPLPTRLLNLLFRMFPQASGGEIHLCGSRRQLTLAAQRRRPPAPPDVPRLAMDPALVHAVWETGEGRLQPNPSCPESPRERTVESPSAARLCVPIVGLTQPAIGAILLETDDPAHLFRQEDLELAAAAGVLAGQAIEFSRAHQILLHQEQTEHQLETAREIQLSMLPQSRPKLRGYAFTDHYASAEIVGGDFFFYEQLSEYRVLLGIADASGKGLAAAMSIARFAGEVRSRLVASKTLKAAMIELNRFVAECGPAAFITCCVCVLDAERHMATIANAGHLPPLLLRTAERRVEAVDTPHGAPPFGIDPDAVCHPVTVPLLPGDRLLLYTDGITEAMNPRNELFGVKRFEQILAVANGDLPSLVSRVIDEVNHFRAGQSPSDDLCLLALERLPSTTA